MTSRQALSSSSAAVAGLVVLVAYLAVQLFWFGAENIRAIDQSPFFEGFWKLLVWVGLCVVATMAIARASLHDAWRDLGLIGPPARGFAFGLIATLPMALAALLGRPNLPDLDELVGTVLFGPFAEEVLFRGFLFTALWKRARWPWPVALAMSSVAFGFAHEYGVPGITLTLGGAALAWIYYRWGSLWPAIGLHAWMNLWWDISRGVNFLGRPVVDAASLMQIVSIVLALGLTFFWTRSVGRAGP